MTVEAPLRRVLSRSGLHRAFTRDLDGRAHEYVYRVESLECRHLLKVRGRSQAAKSRRCRQCEEASAR